MTDHAYNLPLDIAIMAAFAVAVLLWAGGAAWIETRKRRTPGNRHGSSSSRVNHS